MNKEEYENEANRKMPVVNDIEKKEFFLRGMRISRTLFLYNNNLMLINFMITNFKSNNKVCGVEKK